jgi:hypothetical protein
MQGKLLGPDRVARMKSGSFWLAVDCATGSSDGSD